MTELEEITEYKHLEKCNCRGYRCYFTNFAVGQGMSYDRQGLTDLLKEIEGLSKLLPKAQQHIKNLLEQEKG